MDIILSIKDFEELMEDLSDISIVPHRRIEVTIHPLKKIQINHTSNNHTNFLF